METPDITPSQIKAVLLYVFTSLPLFGVVVSQGTQDLVTYAVVGFFTVLLPTVWIVADAVIRQARAKNATAILNSKLNESLTRPTGPSYVEGSPE